MTVEAEAALHAQILNTQFGYNQYVLQKNTEGISQEESLSRPEHGGSNLNWIVGHMVSSRNSLLQLLGGEPVWDEGAIARYARESTPDSIAGDERPIADLIAAFDASQPRVFEMVARMSEEHLRRPAPFSPTENEKETVGTLLASFAFHEAYHAGQTGVLRRLCGKEGALK